MTTTTAAAAVTPRWHKSEAPGIIDRQGSPPAAYTGVVRTLIKNQDWSAIEVSEGTFSLSAINTDVATARTNGQRLRLRIFGGLNCPAWLKTRTGTVALSDPVDGGAGACPVWWTGAYAAAYANLQAALAAAYDKEPVILDVALSGYTFYSEPFIKQFSEADNRTAVVAAGYTRTADEAAHLAMIDAHAVWKHTRTYLAGNPAQFVDSGGALETSVTFTNSTFDYCRTKLGRLAICGNNSVRDPLTTPNPLGATYDTMYAHLDSIGGPISYQTATSAKVGNLNVALQWCVDHKAMGVELPSGYENDTTIGATEAARLTTLGNFDVALRANRRWG